MKLRFHRILAITFLFTVSFFKSAEAQTKKDIIIAKSDTPVYSTAWSPDGKYFASSWSNSTILWNFEDNAILALISGQTDAVTSIKFSPDATRMLSVSKDNSVIVRSMTSEKSGALDPTYRIYGTGSIPIPDAVFTQNGFSLAIPLDGLNTSFCFRLMFTGKFLFNPFASSTQPVFSVDASPVSKMILVCSYDFSNDGTISVYSSQNKNLLKTFKTDLSKKVKPLFSPDGNLVAYAKSPNLLTVESVSGVSRFEISSEKAFVNSFSFSPDGKKIAAALEGGSIGIFDLFTGKKEKEFYVTLTTSDQILSVSWSPDGDFLLAGTEEGFLMRWSLSGKVLTNPHKQYDKEELKQILDKQDKEKPVDINSPQEKKDEKEKKATARDIIIQGGWSTIKSSSYIGSIDVDIGYRSYDFSFMYWGLGLAGGWGLPSSSFPYTFYDDHYQKLRTPYLLSITPYACIGKTFYFEKPKITAFGEISVAPAMRLLHNAEWHYTVYGDWNLSCLGTISAGAQWKFLRAQVGFGYDSNTKYSFFGKLGGVIRITGREKKAKQTDKAKTPEPSDKKAEKSATEKKSTAK